jgi:acyl dehydratase
MKQPYYQDVAPGDEIPQLVKTPTTRQLVMWAGASGDYNPIHYDKDLALARGLPGVVVHGQLAACFLGQLVTDWMGQQGSLKKLSISYKGMNLPGEALTCRGTVTKKYVEDGGYYVVADLWAENHRGEKTLTGKATVNLPGSPSPEVLKN